MYNFASERVRKGLTQSEFAECIGVSKESISRWERGVTMPSIDRLASIADYFGCSTDYLLGRTEERKRMNVLAE